MYSCFSDTNLLLLENLISQIDKSLLMTEEQNNLNITNQLKKKKT